MNDVEARLQTCFAAMFPDVQADKLASVSQENLEAWDSMATATLLNVIEEEFGVAIDFEELEKLTSFQSVAEMLKARVAG